MLKSPIDRDDHVQGNPQALIELVEYGDYQCPYCGEAYHEVKKLQARMKNKLKFVFRNFPLANAHPYAVDAAVAAEVAGKLGKFWEMHDMLFENQESLDDNHLLEYAQKIGLDVNNFESEFGNKKYEDKINEDLESGLRSGVNGTPSFFINGEKYEGDISFNSILRYIELELY